MRRRASSGRPRHEAYFQQFKAEGGGLTVLGPFVTPDPTAASMGIVLEGFADPRVVEWNAVRFR